MIKTIKQTISNIYYWIKKKLIRFKNWLVILILGAAVVAAPLVLPPNIPDIALENIQADYHASVLKGKYRLEKTAFILDAVDENAIQAEVGNKDLSEFTPELTLRKWDDEVNFVVKYKHNEKKKDQKFDIENKKIKWKGKKVEVHYYDIKKGELLHDKVLEHDVFEVEVILLEKPDTNIVSFDIEAQGLKFYYQPELTQEEIDEGANRPENVIGSYAVYHESKQGDYSKMGLKNYRAGKAFHIYRPRIIDNAGTEVWGKLNITDNLLTVEIPQEFLDNAVYPVIVDPTFGCDPESPGGTMDNYSHKIRGTYFMGATGTATSITAYGYHGATQEVAIYKQSDNSKVEESGTYSGDYQTGWHEYDITDTGITAQNYWLLFWSDYIYMNTAQINYDTPDPAEDEGGYEIDTDCYNWSATFTPTSENRKYAIYCTYQAGAADERRMFIVD